LVQIQRKATKYILHDYTSDYKLRLLSLNYHSGIGSEQQDLMYLVKCLKDPLKIKN